MTEDEAFIRAIVDHPGDDTPRLVYADWLDDHDDPRGAYLRAEVEWARPWFEGLRPEDSPKLRDLGTKLDPVWVARVSRPPVGVCCDHLGFGRNEPPATVADLDHVEQELQVKLPAAYRAFLLNHNGGVPTRPFFHNPARRGSEIGWIERFYGICLARGSTLRLSTEEPDLIAAGDTLYKGRYPPTGPRAFVALAANDFPYMNLIGVSGIRMGKVYFHNYYTLHRADKPRKVADSLPNFLLSLRESPELLSNLNP